MKRKIQILAHLEGVKAHLRGGLAFTLVELLVVMGVLAIAGTLILVIFTNALKGNNKTQIVGIIKQNGQAVLEIMDKTIRNADNVLCPTNVLPSGNVLVVVRNGIYTRYKYISAVCIGTCTANGFIQQDSPAKQTLAGSTQEETDTQFVNRACLINDPDVNPAALTDTNIQTGVSIQCSSDDGSCSSPNEMFKRGISAGFKDSVTINFKVRPGVQAPQSIAGQIDAVQFQTTVQLR